MKLYNEALTTRGITTGLYDDTKIRATEQGLNPLVYPNVDWYNEMFNKNALRSVLILIFVEVKRRLPIL